MGVPENMVPNSEWSRKLTRVQNWEVTRDYTLHNHNFLGYCHCVVHCVKLDPPVSLTSLAEWRVSVSLVTFARYFPSRVLVTLVSCMWERPTVVNSAIALMGPSVKASLPLCRAASAECFWCFSLSPVHHARLASPPRLPFTTVHRESRVVVCTLSVLRL